MLLGHRELSFLAEARAASAAVDAAQHLGVLERLVRGRADASAIAHDCELGERGTRLLLSALASVGLVEVEEGGTFQLRRDVAALTDALGNWNQLSEVIRKDRPLVAAETARGARSLYRGLVHLLPRLYGNLPGRFAQLVGRDCLRVLDAGAGAAPWSLAMARRNVACQVTVVDLPEVLDAARCAVARAGLDPQFTFVEGDVFGSDLGSGFDLAIAGNLCHLFDAETNQALICTLSATLRPGGRLAVIDLTLEESLYRPRATALYALGLTLRTSSGRAYTFSSFAGWMREAGLVSIDRRSLGRMPALSLITGLRP